MHLGLDFEVQPPDEDAVMPAAVSCLAAWACVRWVPVRASSSRTASMLSISMGLALTKVEKAVRPARRTVVSCVVCQ